MWASNQQPCAHVDLVWHRLRPRAVSVFCEVTAGAGVDAACDANSRSSGHALIAAVQMGLPSGEGSDDRPHLRARGSANAHQLTQGSSTRGRERARSENYKKRSRLAWGILVEALRNRSLVRASNGGSKMPRRGTSPQNAPASEVAAATRRALHTPKLAFLAASLPKLRAWGLETLEADARLKRLTAPGVVQLEAAMVEVLAACSQRHIASSLLALPIVPCYPTRLISPAAQRRAMCLRPRWQ